MRGDDFFHVHFRSFMVDSGDSDLIQQKLTMSQYIAYRSEPLGQLGDSSFQERVHNKIWLVNDRQLIAILFFFLALL